MVSDSTEGSMANGDWPTPKRGRVSNHYATKGAAGTVLATLRDERP